jgi:hypothetical protein
VIYKSLSDGAVLFAATDEVYFGLNAVGARVWELLPPVLSTVEELCGELARQYPEVDPEVIRADAEELLGDLAAHGLVVPRDAERSDAKSLSVDAAEADHAQAQRVG